MDGRIYLVRHGEPVFQKGAKLCLGIGLDPPLGDKGKAQARELYGCFLHAGAVYTSELLRCRQTAALLTDRSPIVLSGFNELDAGEWDGLTFEEIKNSYKEIWELRGEDWSIPPVGGEPMEAAAERILDAIEAISVPEALVVTSEGVLRTLCWRLRDLDTKTDPMPRFDYGSVTVLKRTGGQCILTAENKTPDAFPDTDEIDEISDMCQTPKTVREHEEAVCEIALELCEKLNEAGASLSVDRLRSAALLHDACRTQGKEHPKIAAEVLRDRGYMKTAAIVEEHHDVDGGDKIDERHVLFLADKLVMGNRRVGLYERFAKSREKCLTPEAVLNHERRRAKAEEIERKVNGYLGGKTK